MEPLRLAAHLMVVVGTDALDHHELAGAIVVAVNRVRGVGGHGAALAWLQLIGAARRSGLDDGTASRPTKLSVTSVW